jgi:surface polysaccharide O-acyltransferase-like enzyme
VLLAPGFVTSFHNSLLPDPGRLAWHALYFFAGAALADAEREPAGEGSCRLRRSLPVVPATAIALLAFAAAYVLLPSVSAGTAPALARAAFAFAWTVAAWGGVLTLFAVARRTRVEPGPRLTLLAEASLWIYLVHLPLVGAFQLGLQSGNIPPVATWALTATGTVGVALLSWLPVRRTELGSLLSGGGSRQRARA